MYSTVLLFVEFNTTLTLAKSDGEKRDFVRAGVGQSCECKTAEADQHWDDGLFSVTPCSSADTA